MQKPIEIINIEMGFDLSEEIKTKAAEIPNNIKLYTTNLINLKSQTINKKQKKTDEIEIKFKNAINILEEAQKQKNPWVKIEPLLTASEFTNTSTLIRGIKRFLRKEDKWILLKTIRNKETVYSLQRFGSDD